MFPIREEELLLIFEFLNGSSLKQCCLTLTSWNNLIGSSHRTMRKFYTKLDQETLKERGEIVLKQSIFSLHVKDSLNEFIKASAGEPCYKSLRHFKASSLTIGNIRILEMFKLLSHLELDSCSLSIINPPLELPKLKNLEVIGCDTMPSIIATDSLTTLRVSLTNENADVNSTVELLLKHHKIENLTLETVQAMFQSNELEQVQFRLKKLDLISSDFNVRFDEENLKPFLKLHQKTLHHLTINLPLSVDTHQLLFANFKHLTSLHVNVRNLPTEESFYFCIQPMKGIKELKLEGRFKSHKIAKLFIPIFPSVEVLNMIKLETALWSAKFLKTLSTFQKNIRHLSLSNLYFGAAKNLLFKQLVSVNVKIVSNPKIWTDFILTHRMLQSITVQNQREMYLQKDIDSMLELPCLTVISFGGDLQVISRVYETIKHGPKNLRTAVFVINNVKHEIVFPFDNNSDQSKLLDKLMNPQ